MGLQPSSDVDVFDVDLEDATVPEVEPVQKKMRVEQTCNAALSKPSFGSGGRCQFQNYEIIKIF